MGVNYSSGPGFSYYSPLRPYPLASLRKDMQCEKSPKTYRNTFTRGIHQAKSVSPLDTLSYERTTSLGVFLNVKRTELLVTGLM